MNKIPKRTKPDFCERNFKEQPYCGFMTGFFDETYGFCKKCDRDYSLHEGKWITKKYGLIEAKDSYGSRNKYGIFIPNENWANKILENSDKWKDHVIEYAKRILNEQSPN